MRTWSFFPPLLSSSSPFTSTITSLILLLGPDEKAKRTRARPLPLRTDRTRNRSPRAHLLDVQRRGQAYRPRHALWGGGRRGGEGERDGTGEMTDVRRGRRLPPSTAPSDVTACKTCSSSDSSGAAEGCDCTVGQQQRDLPFPRQEILRQQQCASSDGRVDGPAAVLAQ